MLLLLQHLRFLMGMRVRHTLDLESCCLRLITSLGRRTLASCSLGGQVGPAATAVAAATQRESLWRAFLFESFAVVGWYAREGELEVPGFQALNHRRWTPAWRQPEPSVGGSKVGYNDTWDCKIGQIFLEHEACKLCQGCAAWEGNGAFPTNAAWRMRSKL